MQHPYDKKNNITRLGQTIFTTSFGFFESVGCFPQYIMLIILKCQDLNCIAVAVSSSHIEVYHLLWNGIKNCYNIWLYVLTFSKT